VRLIWSDKLDEDVRDYHHRQPESDPAAAALTIAAMSFFAALLVMAVLVAWAVR
jgi:hypothetical protein